MMTAGNGGDGGDDLEILESETRELVPVDAEVSTMIATAKRFPRSIAKATKLALAMATMDEDTAASCFYNLPRGGKRIAGPSARLAEIVASSWGNIRFGAEVLDHDEKHVRAQGMCWDLESNVAFQVKVRRRITDSQNRTYNDDMITVTGNAANSIAMRNAVLKVIPSVFWKRIYEAARKVAFGDATTLSARRQQAIDYFAKLGVPVDRLCAAVGKAGPEEIGLEELEALTGLRTAIKEGDTTIDEAFPEPGSQGGAARPRPQRKAPAAQQSQQSEQPKTASAETTAEEPKAEEPAAQPTEATPSNVRQIDGGTIVKKGELKKPVETAPSTPPPSADQQLDFVKLSELYGLMPNWNRLNGQGAAMKYLEENYKTTSATNLTPAQLDEIIGKFRDDIERS